MPFQQAQTVYTNFFIFLSYLSYYIAFILYREEDTWKKIAKDPERKKKFYQIKLWLVHGDDEMDVQCPATRRTKSDSALLRSSTVSSFSLHDDDRGK